VSTCTASLMCGALGSDADVPMETLRADTCLSVCRTPSRLRGDLRQGLTVGDGLASGAARTGQNRSRTRVLTHRLELSPCGGRPPGSAGS